MIYGDIFFYMKDIITLLFALAHIVYIMGIQLIDFIHETKLKECLFFIRSGLFKVMIDLILK